MSNPKDKRGMRLVGRGFDMLASSKEGVSPSVRVVREGFALI